MWVALGVLVIMTLAGLAMLRQMGGGLSIAGNVAFKESATQLGDLGTEAAMATITPLTFDRRVDHAAQGYFATWSASDGVDPTTWTTLWSAVPETTDLATGNKVKWIVHRLCALTGDSDPLVKPGQNCVTAGTRPYIRNVDASPFTMTNIPYYRITAQVSGPRNTVSYTQVVMY